MKQVSLQRIAMDEKNNIGKIFIWDSMQCANMGKQKSKKSIKVSMIMPFPKNAHAYYTDWINACIYLIFVSWNHQDQNVLEKLKNKSFKEKEKLVLHFLNGKMISVAMELPKFAFFVDGISRAITHQIVRHRKMAFGQQSLRVSNAYSNDFRITELIKKNKKIEKKYIDLMKKTKELYKTMIDSGIPIEQARNILPLATETQIGIVTDLRALCDYFSARFQNDAQDEHTFVAIKIALILRQKAPEFYAVIKMFVKNIDEMINMYAGDL